MHIIKNKTKKYKEEFEQTKTKRNKKEKFKRQIYCYVSLSFYIRQR